MENNSARRINFIASALGAKSYLEVGVFTGETLKAVKIEDRVAVDPKFLFDRSDEMHRNASFYEMTSDRYFSQFCDRQFDLFFLDGLHTYDQTLRDFCSTLAHSGPRSVWVIDDTVPTDVFSSWPNQEQAVALRSRFGGSGRAWHGDVFKVILFIESFFPSLSYCTTSTGGNGQTFVWKQRRSNFSPRFKNPSDIEKFSYFDALYTPDAFRFLEEKEALAMVINGLQGA